MNKESQDLRINQWGVDNSFSWDKKDLMRFGKGGVDDAEDAEVILHEYGHADPGLAADAGLRRLLEAGSIGEGFADYWAVTVSNVISPTPDAPCVADWDSVSYTSTSRTACGGSDTDLHYPEDLTGEVHADGRIWSRALWDIRQALGHVKADTIILEAQFSLCADTSFRAAAETTIATAERLYGSSAEKAVRNAFDARGLLG